jgi:hypothetical protein
MIDGYYIIDSIYFQLVSLDRIFMVFPDYSLGGIQDRSDGLFFFFNSLWMKRLNEAGRGALMVR